MGCAFPLGLASRPLRLAPARVGVLPAACRSGLGGAQAGAQMLMWQAQEEGAAAGGQGTLPCAELAAGAGSGRGPTRAGRGRQGRVCLRPGRGWS